MKYSFFTLTLIMQQRKKLGEKILVPESIGTKPKRSFQPRMMLKVHECSHGFKKLALNAGLREWDGRNCLRPQ